MMPFEDLIHDLGSSLGLPLKVDPHQSCRLDFREDLFVQIDLGHNADEVLIGSQLGSLPKGSYRERILQQAMRVNGLSEVPHGILAFSERSDSLILFQFFPLASLDGNKLSSFIQVFAEHAKTWLEAIKHGEIPPLEEDLRPVRDRARDKR